jgi:predicted ester cyclase
MSTALETAVTPGELVCAFLDAICQRDVDTAFALVSPEVQAVIWPTEVSAGYDEARAFFAEATTAFPDLMLTARSVIEFPDGQVLAEVTFEGTQAGDFLGVLNQEKHVDVHQAWVMEVLRDQIVGITGYWDQNQLYRRLGVKRLDQISIAS